MTRTPPHAVRVNQTHPERRVFGSRQEILTVQYGPGNARREMDNQPRRCLCGVCAAQSELELVLWLSMRKEVIVSTNLVCSAGARISSHKALRGYDALKMQDNANLERQLHGC